MGGLTEQTDLQVFSNSGMTVKALHDALSLKVDRDEFDPLIKTKASID